MEFKIDTKDTFTIIMPVADHLSANLTGALRDKWEEMRQSGRNNLIVDFQPVENIDSAAIAELVSWHQQSYSDHSSLVFANLTSKVMAALKKEHKDLELNIAPRMEEAIDIVSMEILERELFEEEG
jgi:anti-anti-sigma regulatory factor